MPRYKRIDPPKCAMCGEDYIIDTEKQLGQCGCGVFKVRVPPKYLLLMSFEEMPEEKGPS